MNERIIISLTLCILGLIDYKKYKIPNVILLLYLGYFIAIDIFDRITPNIIIAKIAIVIVVSGSYIPISIYVKAAAGDFKLFAVLSYVMGVDDMLATLLITMLISLFVLTCGVKKVPIAYITYFGYIAFQLLRMEGFV